MTDAELLQMHMEYDPEALYTWYINVSSLPEGESLVRGFVRDITGKQAEFIANNISITLNLTLTTATSMGCAFLCPATQELFDLFFKLVRECGQDPDEFQSLLIYIFLDPPQITGQKR